MKRGVRGKLEEPVNDLPLTIAKLQYSLIIMEISRSCIN